MSKLMNYFSKTEIVLWSISVTVIMVSFGVFDRENYLTLCASLIGVTSLIFNAKGNPFGQLLMVLFSLLYGIISYTFSYYGEMITYLGMTMPMAVFALISWLRNPYNGNRSEVKVNRISREESFCIDILKCLFSDDNVGFYAFDISYYYHCIALQYAKLGDTENTLKALKESCHYAVMDASLQDMDYTAPMVNHVQYKKADTSKNFAGNSCNLRLNTLEDDKRKVI